VRRLPALAVGALLVPVLSAPASADSQRMQLHCGGDVGVIERTNGASWWGVDHDAGYATEHLIIRQDGEVVFAKSYGRKGPDAERSTCVADHFGSTWTVELVQTR
jgi:hypothetical protein